MAQKGGLIAITPKTGRFVCICCYFNVNVPDCK